MNTLISKKVIELNRLFISILHKVIQRPDFYPIKYYHKRKRDKNDLGFF
ncbi:MAG: hypothetical protein M9904_07845 [Chitinophagaceae bacterium]|nr:hypothetical protein [Chitinophagaceae bacterium]